MEIEHMPQIPPNDQVGSPFEYCYLENDPQSLTITYKPHHIFNLIYQMPIFIWVDLNNQNLEPYATDFKTKTEQPLMQIFTIPKLKQFIKSTKQEQLISIICSEQFVQKIVDKIQIYIKCQKIKNVIFYGENDNQWLQSIPPQIQRKIQYVKNQEEVIQEIVKYKNYYAQPKQFNNFISLEKQIGSSNIIVNTIFAMINQKINRKQLCSQLKELVKMVKPAEQQKTKEIIQRIEQRPLDIQSSIELYTEESFLYGLLNNIIRSTKQPVSIYILQPYFCDLFNSIKSLYEEQKKDTKLKQFKCYRGGVISQQQFKFFQKSINSIIQNLGFMSTSKNQQIAINFIKNVIFEIQVNYSENTSELDFGFAYVEQFSTNKQQHQVIFNPLNTFEVKKVILNENIYTISLKHIILGTIVNQSDINLSEYQQKLKILSKHQIKNKNMYKNQNCLLNQQQNFLKGSYESCQKFLQLALKTNQSSLISMGYFRMGIENQKCCQIQKMKQNYEQFFKIAKNNCQQNQIQYTIAITKISHAYIAQGQKQQALKFMNEIKSENQISLFEIGRIYNQLGENEKAEEFYLKYKNKIEKQKWDNHPNQAMLMNRIGQIYQFQNNLNKALEFYLKAEKIFEKTTGENTSQCATTINQIGYIYLCLCNNQKALEYQIRGIRKLKKIVGQNHISYIISLKNLGENYVRLGKFHRALDYYMQAHNIIKKQFGENHIDYVLSLRNIGCIYQCLRQFEKALGYYLPTKELFKKMIDIHHPDYVALLKRIAYSYESLEDLDEALKYNMQMLEIRKKTDDHSEKSYEDLLKKLANLSISLGNFNDALSFYLQIKDILDSKQNENKDNYVRTLSCIRQIYELMADRFQQQSQFSQAYKYLKKSIKISETLVQLSNNKEDEEYAIWYAQRKISNLMRENAHNNSSYENIRKIKNLRKKYIKFNNEIQKDQILSQTKTIDKIMKDNLNSIDFLAL